MSDSDKKLAADLVSQYPEQTAEGWYAREMSASKCGDEHNAAIFRLCARIVFSKKGGK